MHGAARAPGRENDHVAEPLCTNQLDEREAGGLGCALQTAQPHNSLSAGNERKTHVTL
jgi:hypothetical protein